MTERNVQQLLYLSPCGLPTPGEGGMYVVRRTVRHLITCTLVKQKASPENTKA